MISVIGNVNQNHVSPKCARNHPRGTNSATVLIMVNKELCIE